jgi:DNA sulfur modification protein DndC
MPNKDALEDLLRRYDKVVLLTGHREDESSSRAKIIKRNSVCDFNEMSCNSSFFLKTDVKGVVKVIPIKNWTLADVWEFLENVKDKYGLNQLFELYGDNKEARYGCWHCTLVKVQKNVYNLPPSYLYLEGARVLYRIISDMEYMRVRKNWGRTSLGPLNVVGRGIMLKTFHIVEELSGKKLYGLDEDLLGNYTLREVFYYLEPSKANKLIWDSARGLRDKEIRLIPIEKIREVKVTEEIKSMIDEKVKGNPSFKYLVSRGEKYFYDILERLS